MGKATNSKKKKTNSEAYLAKRREQKKISMRKAREKLKSDPVKHEEVKQNRREIYKKLKNEGKIKLIDDLSEREQRKIRKSWRKRSQNYRTRQKNEKNLQEFIETSTPPGSPEALNNEERVPRSRQSDSGKKLARRNREKSRKEIEELKTKLKKAEKKVNKYKQRISRMKKKNASKKAIDDTPTKIVENLLKGHNVSGEIRKKVLFGEVIAKQLKENSKSSQARRSLFSLFTGKVIKKYRFLEYTRSITSRRLCVGKGHLYKKRIIDHVQILRKEVVKFLERDDNSRMTAGKKETITVKKSKKQKRYLNDTLKNLHSKFIKENPMYINFSYSFFCKLRPFWVVIPKVSDRETCMCKIHANMQLLTTQLYKTKVINEKTPSEVLKSLCCNEEVQEKCLRRECGVCATKEIMFNDGNVNSTEQTFYEKWVTKKVPVVIKGNVKLTQKTLKVKIICELNDLVLEMKNLIKPFMNHVSNIIHQFEAVTDVKKSLTKYEALLHFDFSQNYACKYGAETQAFHFGGSRTQITLHTSVLYYKNDTEPSVLKHKSFGSISKSLRHDPSAVCAHLGPVIDFMKDIVPNLKKVHFLSDGPATQYKSKSMFHLFGNNICKKLDVEEVVWHYSEAGHGKGAADGIGGNIKRLADNLVAKGEDIANFAQFETALKKNSKETTIFSVTIDEIAKIDELLPSEPLKTFVGTMKVHQLTWDKEKPTILQTRKLSCLKCSSSKPCLHFDLGEI